MVPWWHLLGTRSHIIDDKILFRGNGYLYWVEMQTIEHSGRIETFFLLMEGFLSLIIYCKKILMNWGLPNVRKECLLFHHDHFKCLRFRSVFSDKMICIRLTFKVQLFDNKKIILQMFVLSVSRDHDQSSSFGGLSLKEWWTDAFITLLQSNLNFKPCSHFNRLKQQSLSVQESGRRRGDKSSALRSASCP